MSVLLVVTFVSRLIVDAVNHTKPNLPTRHAERVLLVGHHHRGDGRQLASVDPRLHSKPGQAPTISDETRATGELAISSSGAS